MKKSISLSIFFVALLSTIISVHSMNTTNNLENSLLLANIEALTDSSEGGGSGGSGGNWLKGYRMQSIEVLVGRKYSGTIAVVIAKVPGVTIGFEYSVSTEFINCCKRDNAGTDCNKSGNENKCSYLTLD